LPDKQRLCDLVPFKVLTSSELSWNVKESDIIEEGTWVFPLGSPEFQSIWDSITFNLMSVLPYHYIWNSHSSERFSVDLAWEVLRDSRPADSMHHLLWFPGFILRHSFIMWLALWVVSTPWTNYMIFKSFPFRHVFFVGRKLKHMNIYSFNALSLLQFEVLL